MPRAGHGRDLAAAVVGQHGPSTPPTACTRAFGREANSLAHSGDSSPRLAVGTRLLAGLAGRTPKALVRQAVLLPQEPAVDDVPLVASPGLKIQERRSAVLKFKIKFQRVPSGRVRRVDGLRLQPPLPLPGDQNFRFFLFHATRPVCEPKRALVVALVLVSGDAHWRAPVVPLHFASGRCSQPNGWLAAPRSLAAAAPIPHTMTLADTI